MLNHVLPKKSNADMQRRQIQRQNGMLGVNLTAFHTMAVHALSGAVSRS
jgi:hypothetical protein